MQGQPKPKMNRLRRQEAAAGYLFLVPLLTGLMIFFIYSFFDNFYVSFTNKSSFGKPKFIGLKNYIRIFSDEKFFQSLGNTFEYVLVCVPAVIVLSILIAVLLNSKVKLTGIYRTLIFIPAVTMPAAIGLLWKWMFNYEFGLFNAVMNRFGIESVAWLSDPKVVLFSVSIVLIWTDISQRMIILLAGLQGIPSVYYEAAQIDGANGVKRFFHITLPLLSPTIFFCTTMEIIGVFQIFDFIYLMIPQASSGMPAARSVVSLFFEEAFTRYDKGYAAAISMVLFVIILIVTVIQMVGKKRWVYDE